MAGDQGLRAQAHGVPIGTAYGNGACMQGYADRVIRSLIKKNLVDNKNKIAVWDVSHVGGASNAKFRP